MGDAIVIEVDDVLDSFSTVSLERELLLAERSAHDRIVISFAKCNYCESVGLRAIVRALKRLGSRVTVFVPPGGRCHIAFRLTGLLMLPGVFDNLASALKP